MSNYRAITFFDLDGTLLDAKSKITPEVAKAMNALKENNVLPSSLQDVQKQKSTLSWKMRALLLRSP